MAENGPIGRSVEDMAGDESAVATKPAQEFLPGLDPGLSLDAGGEDPTGSSVRLQGGKLPVEGQFNKGDTVRLIVSARCGRVSFVDTVDGDGDVIGTERQHTLTMVSVRRVDEQ